MLSLPMFCSNCKYFCGARNYVTVFHAHVLVTAWKLKFDSILFLNKGMGMIFSRTCLASVKIASSLRINERGKILYI